MPAARVGSIEFISPSEAARPSSGNADVQVGLEDGSFSSFVAATPDQPARWMEEDGQGFSFGTPVLFVGRLDHDAVGEAVVAMAEEMSGYWLRYYNSLGDLSGVARTPRIKEGRKKGGRPR